MARGHYTPVPPHPVAAVARQAAPPAYPAPPNNFANPPQLQNAPRSISLPGTPSPPPPALAPPVQPGGAREAVVRKEALAFERELIEAFKSQDVPRTLALFRDFTSKGVAPSVTIYHSAASMASLTGDSEAMGMIIGDLEKRKMIMECEQFEHLILLTSRSTSRTCASMAHRVFNLMQQFNLSPRSLNTFFLLASCTQNEKDSDRLVRCLKESGMRPTSVTLVQLLRHSKGSSLEAVKQWVEQHDIDWAILSEGSNPQECVEYVGWMAKASITVPPSIFSKALYGVKSGREAAGLLSEFIKSGGRPSESNVDAITKIVCSARDSEAGVALWNSVCTAQAESEGVGFNLLGLLVERNDKRALQLFKQIGPAAYKRTNLINLALKIISKLGLVDEAKQIWRRMQAAETQPDEEGVLLLLRACLDAPDALIEIATVIRASELPLGPEAMVLASLADSYQLAKNPPPPQQDPQWEDPQPGSFATSYT